MNRGYTREWYLQKIARIREILGEDCGLSSDFIAGFCGETDEDHRATLDLMDAVRFDFAYMFHYSERPGTPAAKKFADDVPQEIKKQRLNEIIAKQSAHGLQRNQEDVGKMFTVLVEGPSRRSEEFLQGSNSANKVVVFPRKNFGKGEYVKVRVNHCTGATLIGNAV